MRSFDSTGDQLENLTAAEGTNSSQSPADVEVDARQPIDRAYDSAGVLQSIASPKDRSRR